MSRPTDSVEADFLSSCRLDNALIDQALQAGLSPAHFANPPHRALWLLSQALRVQGKEVDTTSLYTEAIQRGLLGEMGGAHAVLAQTVDNSFGGAKLLDTLIDVHAKRESWKRVKRLDERLTDGSIDLAEVRGLSEEITRISSGQSVVSRDINAIDAEVGAEVQAAREGRKSEEIEVSWGVKKLDRFLTTLKPHEYALVCARPSRGKSSLLSQMAGYNCIHGLRVAYFTLETSDKAVFRQMAAQLSGLCLGQMREWMPNHYDDFNRARARLKDSGRLMIFDRDMTLDALTARCRLLAASWKPQLVLIDYLGLVSTQGKSPYERASIASKAMIPLRKALGCTLVVGQQLNRGSDAQDREPGLGDLRDSGQIEEDAHRIVMLHWKDSRLLDQSTRQYKILQPKLRDCPTTAVDGIEFNAPLTRFREGV